MRAFVAALLVASAPALAFAQQTPPPTPPASTAPPVVRTRPVRGFVIDARGAMGKFGTRLSTAESLGVLSVDLPSPGLGFAAGAHVYPLRLGRVVVGIGGEVMLARRSRQKQDAEGEPSGPLIKSRAFSLSPQVSLNFGQSAGWSYISGGIGTVSFETWNDAGERPDRRLRGINYGGGARWFASPHLAFSFDFRIYQMPLAPAIDIAVERPGQRVMILSAGISLR